MDEIKRFLTRMTIILGYLPLYIISTFFRIVTLVILFTYLNMWGFVSPAILLFANVVLVSTLERSYKISGYTHLILMAVVGVFAPICVFQPIPHPDM